MIEIKYEPDKNRASAYDEEVKMGEIIYTQKDGIWVITRTFVEEEYGGRGVGGRLVAELVNQARLNNKKIYPQCSFALKEFNENPEYSDVLVELNNIK